MGQDSTRPGSIKGTVMKTIKQGLRFTIIIVFTLWVSMAQAGDVRVWCKGIADPTHSLSWQSMQTHLLPALENGEYQTAYQQVLDRFNEVQKPYRDDESETEDAQKFRQELKVFIVGDVGRTTFQVNVPAQINGQPNRGRFNQLIFSSSQHKVVIPCRDSSGDITPARLTEREPQKANVAYAAHALMVVGGQPLEKLYTQAALTIDSRAQGYRGLLFDGLPMWPWELWVNGLGIDQDDLNQPAPRWQWIVARPSVGLEVFWPDQANATVDASVALEPIGFIRYRGKGYKNWMGLSALVTLGSKDNGAGVGAMLRYNNYSFGITKRENIDDVYVFFSMDLYDVVRDKERQLSETESFLGKLRVLADQ